MRSKRRTIGGSDSGSCKVRSLEVFRMLEKRSHGLYKSLIDDDVVKYLLKKKLIKVERQYYSRRCTKDVVYVVPKEKIKEHKPEPYKKRKQRIKDDAAYQKRKK